MNYRKHILLILFCYLSAYSWSQEGIGTNNPNSSAALDIDVVNKGLLIPRLGLTASNSFAPVTGTANTTHNGMIVYNTTTAATNSLTGVGFYVWQGGATGRWSRLTTTQDAGLGSVVNTTLRWDGNKWVENTALRSDGTGQTSITTNLTVTATDTTLNSNLTVTSGGSSPTLFVDATNTQVGIGTRNPNASAALEVDSTTKGFLPPRMTTAQRDAISSPANGLIIFNTTTQSPDFYDQPSNSWKSFGNNIDYSLTSTFITPFNFQVEITNLGAIDIRPRFSTTGFSITGVPDASVTLVGNTTTITLPPLDSHTINFTIDYGTATIPAPMAIQGNYSIGSKSTTSTYTASISTTLLYGNLLYNEITSATGQVWLDRNLGATRVATTNTDPAAYGDSYQWGRATDGHQIRTSGTTNISASTDTPGHDDFITVNEWRSPLNFNLWQGVNSTNNPCPSGFHVPTQSELDSENSIFSSNDPTGAFNSVLKLPLGGLRSRFNATFIETGTTGYYWTSSTMMDSFPISYSIGTGGFRFSTSNTGNGYSVRCIKD